MFNLLKLILIAPVKHSDARANGFSHGFIVDTVDGNGCTRHYMRLMCARTRCERLTSSRRTPPTNQLEYVISFMIVSINYGHDGIWVKGFTDFAPQDFFFFLFLQFSFMEKLVAVVWNCSYRSVWPSTYHMPRRLWLKFNYRHLERVRFTFTWLDVGTRGKL